MNKKKLQLSRRQFITRAASVAAIAPYVSLMACGEGGDGFCSGNDAEARSARWFRGIKTTDSDGNVYFKACFPGWYQGRTTHIHFRVVLNGEEQVISQFAFDDEMANDIYQNHSDYTGQAKDTSNSSDNVFRSSNVSEYLYEVEQQWDGSMLAYKAIQIDRYV